MCPRQQLTCRFTASPISTTAIYGNLQVTVSLELSHSAVRTDGVRMNSKMLRRTVWYKSTDVSEKPAGCNFTKHEINIKPAERSFFQDITPCMMVVGYRCFGASHRFHLQGSSVSSSPSSSFHRSGGTCPNGVTCRVQAISHAQRSCPLAATELIYCMYRAADSSPSHCFYQQVACCRYSPHAQHVFRLATRNKDWHYMF